MKIRAILKSWAHKAVNFLEWYLCFWTPKSLSLSQRLSFLLQRYEIGTTRYIKKLAPRGVVIDVGAHIGYYTCLLAKTAKMVYAFEPDHKNQELLRQNTYGMRNVQIVGKAISDVDGAVSFFLTPNSTFRHSLIREDGAREMKVLATTLDTFVREQMITDISLIKIDVEQAEVQVLLGAQETLKSKPIVIVENVAGDEMRGRAISPNGDLVSLDAATYHGSRRKVANIVLDL